MTDYPDPPKRDNKKSRNFRKGLVVGSLSGIRNYPQTVRCFMLHLRAEVCATRGLPDDGDLPASLVSAIQAAGKYHLLEIEATKQHRESSETATLGELRELRNDICRYVEMRQRAVRSLGVGKESVDPFGGE